MSTKEYARKESIEIKDVVIKVIDEERDMFNCGKVYGSEKGMVQ